MKFLTWLLLIILLQKNISSERILAVVLMPSYSHQMFYQPIWRELSLRGHEVVVVTTDPTNETLPNFKEISISESYVPMKAISEMVINTNFVKIMWENSWFKSMLSLAEFQINLPQFQELINNKTEHFDLLIIEHFLTPAFGLQHRFKCPMIGVMSLDATGASHEIMGNPVHSVLYPPSNFGFSDKLSLIERLVTSIFGVIVLYSEWAILEDITGSARNFFGDDMPPIDEVFERTDMLFINANPVFMGVRPVTPSTILISGGMHMRPPKPLPKRLQKFLDSAEKGAIYFSLGSNVKNKELPFELRKSIMDTFKQLPYKVLWKFEEENLPSKPDNVMIVKWAPQQDILRHKNVKLFVTQGGAQSTEESLYTEVPMVVMPYVGDQIGNAAKVRNAGLGLIVDKYNLTTEDFKSAIMEVMVNPKYQENAKRLGSQTRDTPFTPLESAVWWTEYILRHKGAQHLKGPRIPWYQYYYFDVLIVLGMILSILISLIVCIIVYCFKRICSALIDRCTQREFGPKMKIS